MVYIRVKYAEDKELLANPNCPVRVLYNFIKNARSEAGADRIVLHREAEVTGESLLARGKKLTSQGTIGGHGNRQSSQRKNIQNSSKSIQQGTKASAEVIGLNTKIPSETATGLLETTNSPSQKIPVSDTAENTSQIAVMETLLDEREFDLCDENGQLKCIYDMHPWVNGFETGIFLDHALYIVVLFERDENGLINKPMPVISRTGRVYSDLMIKIRRQLSGTSKQKLRGDKEKSATSIGSKPFIKKTSNPSLTSSI